jgi:hypothetical protein
MIANKKMNAFDECQLTDRAGIATNQSQFASGIAVFITEIDVPVLSKVKVSHLMMFRAQAVR